VTSHEDSWRNAKFNSHHITHQLKSTPPPPFNQGFNMNFVQSSGSLCLAEIFKVADLTRIPRNMSYLIVTNTLRLHCKVKCISQPISVLRYGHMCHQASWHALGDPVYAGELQQPNTINIYRQNANTNTGVLNTWHTSVLPATDYIRIDRVISFIFPLMQV
jgi:hypothetical protein